MKKKHPGGKTESFFPSGHLPEEGEERKRVSNFTNADEGKGYLKERGIFGLSECKPRKKRRRKKKETKGVVYPGENKESVLEKKERGIRKAPFLSPGPREERKKKGSATRLPSSPCTKDEDILQSMKGKKKIRAI